MSKKITSKKPFPSHLSGQALSEYLILTVMIAIASIVAVNKIGKQVFQKMELIQRNLQNVTLESVRGDG